MRTIVIALAGLLVVGAIGGAAIAMMPTSNTTPLDAIRVEAPQSINPVPPAPRSSAAPVPPPAPSPTNTPPPADSRGVPQPPPPVVQAPPRGADGWDDDDGDDWDDDDDDDWDDDDWGDDD